MISFTPHSKRSPISGKIPTSHTSRVGSPNDSANRAQRSGSAAAALMVRAMPIFPVIAYSWPRERSILPGSSSEPLRFSINHLGLKIANISSYPVSPLSVVGVSSRNSSIPSRNFFWKSMTTPFPSIASICRFILTAIYIFSFCGAAQRALPCRFSRPKKFLEHFVILQGFTTRRNPTLSKVH